MEKKLILGSITLLAIFGLAFSKIAGYIYRIILSKLGVAEYGTFILALSIISFALIISKLGLDSGIQRYVPYYQKKGDNKSVIKLISFVYIAVLISSLFLSGIIYILSPFLADIFENSLLESCLRILLPVIPIAALSYIALASLKSFDLGKEAIFSQYFIERIFLIVVTSILVGFSLTIQSALYAYVLASLLTLIISTILLIKQIRRMAVKPKRSVFSKKEIISYSLPLMFASLSYIVIRYIDIILLGIFVDARQVGLYDVAILGALSLFILPEAIMYLFTPKISRLLNASDKNKFNILVKNASRKIVLINTLVALIIIFCSSFLINFLLDSSYLTAAAPMSILSIGVLFRTYQLPKTYALAVLKNTRTVFKIDAVCAIVNILLNLYLIPKYGIMGAAIATSLGYLIMGCLTIYYYKKLVK